MQERPFTVAWVYVERTTGDQNLSRALHYGVSHSSCCFGTSNQINQSTYQSSANENSEQSLQNDAFSVHGQLRL